jgi:ABC-2 type transport system ATP-binding protein
MTDGALEIRALRKVFSRLAVDNLDLTVKAGELYALLGPNGAGKTTTLRMVAGLTKADAGSIRVFGTDAIADPVAAKRLIAWLPDEPMLYDKLTPMEYLEFVAGLWGVDAKTARKRAQELLEFLALWPHRGERCEGFSRGMKQKAALAGALIHEPKLLMLDEPLTGLDAAMARQVKDLLQQRVKAGATVILTTHILDVAERMADRIGIIQHGKLLAEGTLDELRAARATAGRRWKTSSSTSWARTSRDQRHRPDPAAGIGAWLLAAEVRLGLRGMAGKRGGGRSKVALIIISIVAGAGVLFGGVSFGFLASRWPLPITPLSALIVDAACVVLFTLMLSQAINLAVQALYERGDLDLLLSSPLKPRVVLTVRALSITVVASSSTSPW